MANPLRPDLIPAPPLAEIMRRPSVSPAVIQGPSQLAAILQALQQTPVPQGPDVSAADYQQAQEMLGQLGGTYGRIGGNILGAAKERISSQLPPWFKSMDDKSLTDIVGGLAGVPEVNPALARSVPPEALGIAPAGSPGVGAPGVSYGPVSPSIPVPGADAANSFRQPVGSFADALTRPEFAPPDFSKTEALAESLSAGTAPEMPTTRENVRAAVMYAALGAASGRDLPQALALAGAGALQGRAQVNNEYLDRLERYEARQEDVKLKRLEIASNVEMAERNFEMQQQSALNSFEIAKAQIQMEEAKLQSNEAMRHAELTQPYVGVAGNRLMIVNKDSQGGLILPPQSFVINELEDQVAGIVAQANLMKAMGATGSTVTLGQGALKATINDPVLANAISAGLLWLEQNRYTSEGEVVIQQAQEEIKRRNPNLEMMKPDAFEAAVNAYIGVNQGIGMFGRAAAGRGAYQFPLGKPLTPTPQEPPVGSKLEDEIEMDLIQGLGPILSPAEREPQLTIERVR